MKLKTYLIFLLTTINLLGVGQSTNKQVKANLSLQIFENFKYIPEQDLVTNNYEGFDSLTFYNAQRSHISEFYISSFELSNKDYKQFTDYVWDSLFHSLLGYTNIFENKKCIDWDRKIDWNNKLIRKIILDSFGLKSNQRIFNNEELDFEKCIYSYNENNTQKKIKIYPDTSCWLNNFYGNWSKASELFNRYYKTKDFENYPVVGINYWQALAYCAWKTQVIKNLIPKNFKFNVFFTLPTSSEWEAAANNYPLKIFKYKKIVDIAKNKNWNTNSHKLFYADKNKTIKYNYNFFSIIDPNGYTFKEVDEDGYFFTSPVKEYEPNLNGLYNMNGNVAEWVSEDTLNTSDIIISKLKKQKKYQKNEKEELLKNFPNTLLAKLGIDSFSTRMNKFKIIKGGSWFSTPFYLQNGVNQYYLPSENSNFIGFRIVAHFRKKV